MTVGIRMRVGRMNPELLGSHTLVTLKGRCYVEPTRDSNLRHDVIKDLER
jgi:hypothetical protein